MKKEKGREKKKVVTTCVNIANTRLPMRTSGSFAIKTIASNQSACSRRKHFQRVGSFAVVLSFSAL